LGNTPVWRWVRRGWRWVLNDHRSLRFVRPPAANVTHIYLAACVSSISRFSFVTTLPLTLLLRPHTHVRVIESSSHRVTKRERPGWAAEVLRPRRARRASAFSYLHLSQTASLRVCFLCHILSCTTSAGCNGSLCCSSLCWIVG
jgi:hypothetical protein